MGYIVNKEFIEKGLYINKGYMVARILRNGLCCSRNCMQARII